jgi:hypothetical protein
MSCLKRVFQALLLAVFISSLSGCATSRDSIDPDSMPVLEPSQSNEDSFHGWGAGIKGT